MHENCDAMKERPGEELKRQLLPLIKMAAAVRREIDLLFNR
jgi:hypothetical protein